MNCQKAWFIARDVTNSKLFNNYELAIDWCKKLEEAGSIKGELMLETICKGTWKVYW